MIWTLLIILSTDHTNTIITEITSGYTTRIECQLAADRLVTGVKKRRGLQVHAVCY